MQLDCRKVRDDDAIGRQSVRCACESMLSQLLKTTSIFFISLFEATIIHTQKAGFDFL